jgi:hypothetical protein
MKYTRVVLTAVFMASCPYAVAQDSRTTPTEIYKCTEGGKAVYQDGLCASGPNKPLKSHDAKGIEAPKSRAPEYAPPAPAPVAVIPYTPSKPLGNTGVARQPSSCRSVNGSSCPPTY